MKVTLLQQDIIWKSVAENIHQAQLSILASPGSDLYVLPEMWATGFAVNPDELNEDEANDCLEWMKDMSAQTNAAIAGSLAVRDNADGSFRNRFYFVKPDGTIDYYDKHHLFSYGGENNNYKPGNNRVITEWKGVRFLLLVCYDLRFPVWSRNDDDYDAIIYTASWPTSRIEVWRTLLKARALENQCYVLGVNRIGTDPNCQYCGSTMFVDPYGRATQCADNEQASLTMDINMAKLEAFRTKFPVLKDRD